MKDRILQIIKSEQLTAMQFAKETGIQQASLSHILNGRNNPSLEIIKKIHQRFPHINLDWLLYGEGNMMEEQYLSRNHDSSLFFNDGMNVSKDIKHRNESEIKESLSIINDIPKENIKYIERAPKKIIEVRIFFDDGTYETLLPQK